MRFSINKSHRTGQPFGDPWMLLTAAAR